MYECRDCRDCHQRKSDHVMNDIPKVLMHDTNILKLPVQDTNIPKVLVQDTKVPVLVQEDAPCDNAFKNYNECLNPNPNPNPNYRDHCLRKFSDPEIISSACVKCVTNNQDNIDVCVSKENKQAFMDAYNTAKQLRNQKTKSDIPN